MAELATYEDAIVETLRKRAVQSAILIDDRFPTYIDLLAMQDQDEIRENFQDVDDARRLYRLMHENKIVCDVENVVGHVDDAFLEKIRKSDLVVLDWNLNPNDHGDCESAVNVLCGLSISPHFNLVVIYTRDELDQVWTRSAVRLHGGWREKEDLGNDLDLGGQDLDQLLEDIDPDGHVNFVTDEMLQNFVQGGLKKIKNYKDLINDLVKQTGIPAKSGSELLTILIHRAAIKRHGALADGSCARVIEGSPGGNSRYINVGSLFVCLVSKPVGDEQAEQTIFDHLDRALVTWNPSVLQLLVSELQNELEHHSYAFDHSRMPSNKLKAGWMYHMLRMHCGADGGKEAVLEALNLRLIETIEESIRGQMSVPTSNLSRFGQCVTQLAVTPFGDLETKSEIDLVRDAVAAAGLDFNESMPCEVLHALNEYLSADPFRGGHVTVGSILCDASKDHWWLCVSPACDMVPRKHSDEFSWQFSVHPFRPMTLLKLEKGRPSSVLAEAEQGAAIFVTVGEDHIFLRATEAKTRQPRPITCLLEKNGFTGHDVWQKYGFAFHELKPNEDELRSVRTEVFAVSQLRPHYAARFQHLAGGHQSRIGVDYVRYGKSGSDG
ncbi:response regulator receiver domain [Novosphingobium sediminicola]|uniref:Response receiver domain-containing protein n=1 Tax=Novosphingobium sediminicola TaxID=563162 RepID=A0A7W6CDE4_9SPHN|nr:response regulator receiver domain [Novosphingobium sediminicola]MBB3953415.1 hypothetical protein [Novosphingobium sediminicola]